MTAREIAFIKVIRESPDPAKTMSIAMDVLTRILAGESIESICVSYGIDPKQIKNTEDQNS